MALGSPGGDGAQLGDATGSVKLGDGTADAAGTGLGSSGASVGQASMTTDANAEPTGGAAGDGAGDAPATTITPATAIRAAHTRATSGTPG